MLSMPTLGAMGLAMTDEARERKRQRDRERYRQFYAGANRLLAELPPDDEA